MFDKLREMFNPSLETGLGVEGLDSSEGQYKLLENGYKRQTAFWIWTISERPCVDGFVLTCGVTGEPIHRWGLMEGVRS